MCKNVSPAQTSSCYYFLAVLVNKYRTEPDPTQTCFSGSSKKCFSSATQVTVHVLFSAHCYVFVSVPVPGPPSVPGPFPGHVPSPGPVPGSVNISVPGPVPFVVFFFVA